MSPPFRVALIWIVGALAILVFALMPLSGAWLNGEYVPSNADAFYHARRALDVAMTGNPVTQFDARIHVPEGSWINWPWAYDSVLGWITRGFGPFASEAEANRVLLKIPVACAPLFIAIVLGVARLLRFPATLTILLVLGMAALPVNFQSFAVGNIDHHFAEGMWTALSLLAGMWFFASPRGVGPGIVLGLVLATALGVHNSLFILQLPVALLFALRWLRQQPLPDVRSTGAFAASLLLLTLAISAPSQPWQRGFFEFYTLSWFHTYISFCTGLFCVLMSSMRRTRGSLGILAAAAILAILPIWNAIDMAQAFIRGETEVLSIVMEVQSPYALERMSGMEGFATANYSGLIWLSMPATVFSLVLAWRASESRLQFFALGAAFGLALMQFQYRFHVFGELALVAVPLLAIHLAQQRWPQWSSRWAIGACVALLLLYLPTTRKWTLNWDPGGNATYQEVATAFPVLREACASRPGVVLTELDAGHWVSYHTRCGVIGDVFLLTAQHARKADELRGLMRGMTPEQVLVAPQNIRYVLVFHGAEILQGTPEPDFEALLARMWPLESGLLGQVDRIPPQYHLLWQSLTPTGQVYARLFEIVR
jgi:hypothetical protein